MLWAAFIIGGFISGSVLYCYILPKKLRDIDIYETGDDHNPGGANAFKACGKKIGLICIFLDILKGSLPVLLACRLLDVNHYLFSLVLIAPVLGHALGIFNRFRGGKCISTVFGVLIGLMPYSYIVLLLALLYVLSVPLFKNQSGKTRSIAVFLVFGLSSAVILIAYSALPQAIACLTMSAIAIAKHHIVPKKNSAERIARPTRR